MRKVDEYSKQADVNSRKSAHEFQIGDFINTATACGKDVNFYDFIDARENWHMGSIARMCKIVDIVDVPEDEDFLTNWMSKPAPSHTGGSQSDDVDENKAMYSLTKEDYETFFDLITVFRKPSGKWIGVDCQGYDYWRYVHMPVNYGVLFSEEREAVLAEMARIKAEKKAERMQELASHLKALEDRENELKIKYQGLILNPTNGSQMSGNVRKFLAIEFPGEKFKVTARKSYWGDEYDVEVTLFGCSTEKVNEIANRCRIWSDTMPVGREYDDGDGNGKYEPRRCPMAIFGNVRSYISLQFKAE